MKNLNYKSIVAASAVALAICLAGPVAALAAAPSLGSLIPYGVVSSTFTNTNPTTVAGSVCYTTGPVAPPTITGAAGACPGGAGGDQLAALNNGPDGLNVQACTSLGALVALDSAPGHATGVYTPGCYSTSGAGATSMTITTGQTVTLNGPGVYIFKAAGALKPAANTHVVLTGGATANNVFWAPVEATTIGANSTFAGNIVDAAGITIGSTSTLLGRALAFGGTVLTDTDTITVPPTTLTVVKVVVGGSKVIADFPLFIDGATVTSGFANTATAGIHTVSETADPGYISVISGDCDPTVGTVTIAAGDAKICTITNTVLGATGNGGGAGGGENYFTPPLISVVKVPTPLTLPVGGGTVTYNYTLRNIGLVPVSTITMVDDSCSPLVLVSGDVNGDSKLDMNETWTYTCSTHLLATHTNNVIATGWYNGVSTTDIANATVVVGLPVVPPLIHVVKIPNPMALSAGGGLVTYTKSVTNPGTVPLSNVQIADDLCNPVQYISGDTNGDSKLDPSETWLYTCQANLTATTTNTVTVSGVANGLTARDFAIATVVVNAAPALPNTGLAPEGNNFALIVSIIALLISLVAIIMVMKKRKI